MGEKPDVRVVHRLSGLAELMRANDDLYVRFGPDPDEERDRSIDYESDFAYARPGREPAGAAGLVDRPLEDWLARQVCRYVHLTDRSPTCRLGRPRQGRRPRARHRTAAHRHTVVARLGGDLVAEARHRYRDRFDHGRTGH